VQISTVTYLTRDGSPTIVLDCTAHTQYGKVQRQDISRAWVSFPCPQKHMSFDGRLLHGAPALQQLQPDAVRVTFLANVWLNHHPMSLRPLPSSTAKQLLPPLPSLALNLKHSSCTATAADSTCAPQTFSFGPSGGETQLTLPLPPAVTQGGGAGQSLSIRCLPFYSLALARCCVRRNPLRSYTREVKAVIAPAATSKHKAIKPAASAAGGGSSRKRRL